MKDKFKKELWISFGIIIVAVFGAAAGLYFLSSNLHAKAAQIIQNRVLIATQNTFLGSLADLKRDAPLAAQYEVAIDRLLPTQYQLINSSQWANGVASSKGVSATLTLQGNPVLPQGTTAGTEAFSLSVDGPTANIIAFLQAIEAQEPAYLLSLNSFDATADGTTGHLSAQGVLYFQ